MEVFTPLFLQIYFKYCAFEVAVILFINGFSYACLIAYINFATVKNESVEEYLPYSCENGPVVY